jgi:hypothetical protein
MSFVTVTDSFVDAVIRADTEADWVQGAVFYGLLVPGEDGELLASPGVHVDVIGPVMLDPGDPETGEGAVIDPRLHINLRLTGPALQSLDETGALKWQAMVAAWSTLGDPDPTPNANEEARILHKVALIRPDSITTPVRVWA